MRGRINLKPLKARLKLTFSSLFVRCPFKSRYPANVSSNILRHYGSSSLQIRRVTTALPTFDGGPQAFATNWVVENNQEP